MEIEKLIEIIAKLEQDYRDRSQCSVDRRSIEDALYILLADKFEFEWRGSILEIDITYFEAKALLSSFKFDTLDQKIETSKEILPEGLQINNKVRIRSKGLVWVIHLYDADPFPSNPHAHQLDNNIKLDLSNGRCYKARKYVHSISTKELINIRSKAARVYKGALPPLMVSE